MGGTDDDEAGSGWNGGDDIVGGDDGGGGSSERAGARERHGKIGKQANRHPARNRRPFVRWRLPRPGAGDCLKQAGKREPGRGGNLLQIFFFTNRRESVILILL